MLVKYFAVVLCLCSGTLAGCNWDVINTCKNSFELEQPDGQNPVSVPALNETNIEIYCSDYETYTSCVKPSLSKCDARSSAVAVYVGQIEGIGYVCGDGLDVYINNNDCTGTTYVSSQMETCNTTLFQALDNVRTLRQFAHTEREIRDLERKFWMAMDNAVDCNVAAVGHCMESARQWMERVGRATLYPLHNLLGGRSHHGDSHEDGDEEEWWGRLGSGQHQWGSDRYESSHQSALAGPEIAGIVIGLLVLIGITIAFLLMCAKKQALVRTRRARTYSPDSPTPQPAPPTLAALPTGQKSALPHVEGTQTPEWSGSIVAPPAYAKLPPIGQTETHSYSNPSYDAQGN